MRNLSPVSARYAMAIVAPVLPFLPFLLRAGSAPAAEPVPAAAPPPPPPPATRVLDALTFANEPGRLFLPARETAAALGWPLQLSGRPQRVTLKGTRLPEKETYRLPDGTLLFATDALGRCGLTLQGERDRRTQTFRIGEQAFVVSAAPKHVEVNRAVQRLRAWQGERLVLETPVSTGKRGMDTPTGAFTAGPIKAPMLLSRKYNNAPMPWSVQVFGNVLIHGSASVPPFAASHGCVRMPLTSFNPARWLYRWIDLGTPIRIADRWHTPALAGYTRTLPAEPAAARAARHARVAARRAGPAIIVHRGASAFAPENTLEAYAAAMDYGADGCEVDVRRTRDGVLVLFHDDMLDNLTTGFGTVPQLTYAQLLALQPRASYGTATDTTRPPTFAALLALARQRGMLLHLDVKETGLDAAIARLLDQADAWDHVVAVNAATAPLLSKNPRFRPLAYKTPGLYEERLDLDPKAVEAALEKRGELLMVDDPRVAARALKRHLEHPVGLPAGLRASYWGVPPATRRGDGDLIPAVYLQARASKPATAERLVALLNEPPAEPGATAEPQERAEWILDRAWAAQQLGAAGRKSKAIVTALEATVRQRRLHRDWMYCGLDGAMAVRSLARLGARESVPVLVEAFRRVDPTLAAVRDPQFAQHPIAWTDFRVKMPVMAALGELRSPESKAFLLEYVGMDEPRARELAPLQFAEATRALLKQELTQAELEGLLRSDNAVVRGTALLECVDRPSATRTGALRAAAPWALELPAARKATAAPAAARKATAP